MLRTSRRSRCSESAVLIAAGLLLGGPGLAIARPTERAEGLALVPGEAQQFELQLGGSRRHPLTLEAGQFLHVELREKGPRVVLTLLDPNGAEVARRQTLIETITLVRLFAIAATSGNYTLEVLSSGQGLSGSYEARLEQPRPATDRDRMLMAADNALGDAARLSDENNGESRRAALARLDAAEAGFRASGDRLGEAFALHDRGVVQYSDGDRATLESMERALGLFRALGDRAGEAAALGGVGRARVRKGDIDSALAALQDATALAETLGDNRTLAHYVNGVGIVLDLTGQFEGSLDRFRRALDLGARQGDPRSEARALANIGTAYSNLGDSPRALDHYERALLLWRSVGNRAAEVTTLNNVGAIYTELGDHARARAIFEQALTLAHEANLTDDEIRLLYNAAWIRHCQREYRQALDLAERSLALSRQIGDRFGEADALALIGNSLHGLGETEAALSNLNEALRIRQAILDRHFESDTRHSIAMLERDRGHLAEARRQAEEALSLIEALRSEATSPELRASYVATQQDKYGFYIDLLMRLHEREPAAGHDAAALRVSERARARVLLEALVQARADIRQGVEAVLLEEERKLQKQLRAATEAVSPAEEEGHGEGGARARRQLETASEALRLLQSRIRRESPRYAALTQPVPASLEEIRRDVLDDDTVLLEFSLGDERSFLWAVTRFDLVSQALPARAQVETAARRVHALLTERQRTRTPAAVREADRQLETESMALSRLLLGGIAPRLATDWKGKRLLIVGSGALAYLPFGALPSPAAPATQPLLRDHEVVFAPSASVLVALRLERTGEATTTTTLAVLADPVFDAADPRVRTTAAAKGARPPAVATGLTRAMDSLGGRHFSRLPFSRQEADAIATFVPRRSLLKATDFQANRALVADRGLGDRRVVHFATHGLLNSEHPDLSGLVLSLVDEKGAAQDGFLRMHEIYNLRLPADLVVLSACQTALGREIRGEGLMGLTRGFMYAGARRVVASLWQVDDESTAELMKRFYRGMLKDGRRPAEALRTAQLEMSRDKRWSAPFYWAGFVLQGEWR